MPETDQLQIPEIRVESPNGNISGNLRRTQSAQESLHVDPANQPTPRPMSAPVATPDQTGVPGLLIPTIYEQLYLDVD
jgi:hypothetical protein